MQPKLVGVLSLAGILISLGAVSAKPVGDDVPFPNEFRDWFAVNSTIVTKDSPIFGQIERPAHYLRECERAADAEKLDL